MGMIDTQKTFYYELSKKQNKAGDFGISIQNHLSALLLL